MPRSSTLALLVLVLAVYLPAGAANGAIPIWEPTNITQPGSYILTRDITAAGVAIFVNSDNVTLNLNGFTVQSPQSIAIFLPGTRKRIDIQNGTVLGQYQAGFRQPLPWRQLHAVRAVARALVEWGAC